jgi:DNA-binding Lrp family transcriptional regulator
VDVHPQIDDVDRQIIALLRDDARRSFQDIGSRVSLSAPAVKRRVDRLRAGGVIRGFTTLIDPGRFGWHAMAIVELTTEGRFSAADVKAAVSGHPEVAAAYTVAGQASAILVVRAEDTVHLEKVLERLRETPAIIRTRTAVVLSTLYERPFSA